MAYFQDLSEYTYLPGSASGPSHRNVGWLAKPHRFERGSIPEAFVEKLRRLCAIPHHPTRGFHVCDFCRSPAFGVLAMCEGGEIRLGSAEIRVEGRSGIVYCAPNLILHYVADHQYLPPPEFLAALTDT
jgi:hypothetical protein